MRTSKVLAILKSNSIFNVLNEKNVRREPIEVDQPFEPALPDGAPSGIEILPFAVSGKGAWYLEGKAHPGGGDGAGDTLGFASRTRRPASISISSPPAPRSPTSSSRGLRARRWCSSTARCGATTN